jgi:cysteinyl-tRNA synthetase
VTAPKPSHPADSTRGASGGQSVLRRALLGLVILVSMTAGGAWLMDAGIETPEDSANTTLEEVSPGERLAAVRSWGYQLQGLDVDTAARQPVDLLVIDEQFEHTRGNEGAAAALRQLKQKPDGQRRLVLSYISIGEAEEYRPYWHKNWVMDAAAGAQVPPVEGAAPKAPAAETMATSPAAPAFVPRVPSPEAPSWLGPENPDWRGNYRIRYWDPDWQALMFGSPEAAIDRLIAAGFDGVYLDRADVYSFWSVDHPTAKADIAHFVQRLSEYAKAKSPGFLIVMQNAEELLGNKPLRAALDAVAKEDLLYGVEGSGKPNSPEDIKSSINALKRAQRDSLPVFVVEYLDDPATITASRALIESEGFIATFNRRALDSLRPND